MKYLLFTTPRTGSTYLSHIIYNYLKEKYPYRDNFIEYFNHLGVFTDNNQIIFSREQYNGEISTFGKIKFEKPEDNYLQKRFEFLQKYNDHLYFFKIHPHQINDEIFSYLNNEYKFICIERRDKLEQFLSTSLALHFNIWHSENPVNVKENSIIIDRDRFDSFKSLTAAYKKYKHQIKHLHSTIYFEDAVTLNNRYEILSKIQFNDWEDTVKEFNIMKTENTYEKNKIRFFINKDEIREWMDEIK